MRTLVVDIDGTLLISDFVNGEYCNAVPTREVEKLRALYRKGWRVILHTGRHWNMYDNTVKQLEQFDIPYNQLVMGKPLGIYVDADAIRTLDDVV